MTLRGGVLTLIWSCSPAYSIDWKMFHVYLRLISSRAAYWRYQRWMSRAALMAVMREGVCWTFLFHLHSTFIISVFNVSGSPVAAFLIWASVKVQAEFCRGYQTGLAMKKRWWKESYLPGTEMLTEREKCRMQRWSPAMAKKKQQTRTFSRFWEKPNLCRIFSAADLISSGHIPWPLAVFSVAGYFMWGSGQSAAAAGITNKHLKCNSENMHQKCQLWISRTDYLTALPARHHPLSAHSCSWSFPCTLPGISGSWISVLSISGGSCDRLNKNMMKVDYRIKLYYERHLPRVNGWGLW